MADAEQRARRIYERLRRERAAALARQQDEARELVRARLKGQGDAHPPTATGPSPAGEGEGDG